MRLERLIARNIKGNGLRSLVVMLCVLVLAGSILATTMIVRGAEAVLALESERLGADLVVIPEGSVSGQIGPAAGAPGMDMGMEGMAQGPSGGGRADGVLLLGKLTDGWMPASIAERVSRVPGVAAASPQLYIATVGGSSSSMASMSSGPLGMPSMGGPSTAGEYCPLWGATDPSMAGPGSSNGIEASGMAGPAGFNAMGCMDGMAGMGSMDGMAGMGSLGGMPGMGDTTGAAGKSDWSDLSDRSDRSDMAGMNGQGADAGPFLVAFDQATDFTLRPWLRPWAGTKLKTGEAFVGSEVIAPGGGSSIRVFGYNLVLEGILEPTGTSVDRALLVNFDTAREIVSNAQTAGMGCCRGAGMMGSGMTDSSNRSDKSDLSDRADTPGMMGSSTATKPPGSVSAVLVRLAPNANIYSVAAQIAWDIPGVTTVESPGMFRSLRSALEAQFRGALLVLAIIWGVSVLVTGLVFSVAINERRREIGVLRALGSTRLFVFRSLLAEAVVLAVAGGLLGSALAGAATYILRGPISGLLDVSIVLPELPDFLAQVGVVLVLALASALLAVLYPAIKVSRQDPALAMRE